MSIVERPGTEVELAAVVRAAAAQGRPVRAGQPSRSRYRRGRGVLLDLTGYHRILRVDREAGEATFEAGATMSRVGKVLGSWGLSMENGCRVLSQSLGAAVSEGAHGSGAAFAGLGKEVLALRLVTPGGDVVACSARQEPEIFDAARVGRGALGIISTVTLRCRPGFNIRSAVEAVALDEAIERFEQYSADNDYFELTWVPGRSKAKVVTGNRTSEVADGAHVDRSYRWWGRRRIWPPLLSYAFPSTEAGPVLQRAKQLGTGARRRLPFPIEVSVTAGDDIPLSPAHGRPTLYVAGVAGLDGRPEWGCPHGLSETVLRDLYPRWDAWQAVRDRLDPDRRFAGARH